MRKIDKTQILATEYQSWIEQLDRKAQTHSKYYSSHKYYKDVLISLLYCQKGLCAYTEIMIAEEERYSPENFDEVLRLTRAAKICPYIAKGCTRFR
ncbi:MAG: hypothetical protein ABFS56_29365 [Pseudomonadota bacterium]